jgi:hypothetical protein
MVKWYTKVKPKALLEGLILHSLLYISSFLELVPTPLILIFTNVWYMQYGYFRVCLNLSARELFPKIKQFRPSLLS